MNMIEYYYLCGEGFFVVAFFLREIKSGKAPRLGENAFVNTIGRKNMRVRITMVCSECKQRNYNTMKNKKNDPDRLEMSKYCPFCKKHTVHKESK